MRWRFCGTTFYLMVCVTAACARAQDGVEPSWKDDTAGTAATAANPLPANAVRNPVGMAMVRIPAGEFTMGSPDDEEGRLRSEGPLHRVRITKTFYLGAYEVTQSEYFRVTGRNPSCYCNVGIGKEFVGRLKTGHFPVEMVTWYDAVDFCNRLSATEGLPPYYRLSDIQRDRMTPSEKREGPEYKDKPLTICIGSAKAEVLGGTGYRLPTEAEWEYACRAGTTTPFSFGNALNGREANCDGRSRPYGTRKAGPYLGHPTVVGSYPPNAFGLYDMHGNVAEWCADWSDLGYYRRSPRDDPPGPSSGGLFEERVTRGGTFGSAPEWCRSATQCEQLPGARFGYTGFRVARTAEQENNKRGE